MEIHLKEHQVAQIHNSIPDYLSKDAQWCQTLKRQLSALAHQLIYVLHKPKKCISHSTKKHKKLFQTFSETN